MWHLETYDGTQDLTNFFNEAEKKRYYNNSNADMLLSSLEKKHPFSSKHAILDT